MFIVCLQLLRWKNAVLSSKTALFEDERQKIPGSSSKTALYEDGWQKIPGSSSKTALYEDGWQKIPGLSSKTALYEDGVRYYKLMEHQKLNFLGKIRVVLQ